MTSLFKMRRGGQKIRKSNDTFIVKKGATTWGEVGPGSQFQEDMLTLFMDAPYHCQRVSEA